MNAMRRNPAPATIMQWFVASSKYSSATTMPIGSVIDDDLASFALASQSAGLISVSASTRSTTTPLALCASAAAPMNARSVFSDPRVASPAAATTKIPSSHHVRIVHGFPGTYFPLQLHRLVQGRQPDFIRFLQVSTPGKRVLLPIFSWEFPPAVSQIATCR